MTALLRLPRPNLKPIILDPLAFVLALIGAPLVVAVLGFWIVFIPVFAIVFGGPLYLALGIPALLWYLPRYGVNAGKVGLLAAFVNILGSGIIALFLILLNSTLDADDFAYLYLGFGTPVAFAWGLAFGLIYPRLIRAPYRALNHA